MTSTIPVPPAVPFLGHVTSVEREVPLRSFSLLSKQYGEIFQLNLIGRTPIFINSVELVNDVSDEKKFSKSVTASLTQVRNAVGDGLFTACKDEPGWGVAHRLLMPAFGTANIREMFPDMLDIAQQLVLKWDRFGPGYKIDPAEDFTRLTLDTIALCSMSYRLNSFYRENNHPFVTAMVDFLVESGYRANRPSIVNAMMRGTSAKYEQDIKTMADLADEIIEERRRNSVEKKDLLNIMLYSTDPKTGEHLSDATIRNNLLTFLIAGHETTSGLLTFTLYYLIKNPDAMRKAREEVDEVLGDGEIQLTDLGKLKYIVAAMRESIRLSPTAPLRTATANEDTVIGGGKYFIPKGQNVVINAERAQRDPKVFGDDADEFKPERMLDGKFEALPPNAWQPFGFGMRACIGRPFAWQEAQLALALIIQKFDFTFDDPSYELELKQSLTIKPAHFYVHAIPRSGKPRPISTPSTANFPAHVRPTKSMVSGKVPITPGVEPTQPLYVLYGSNTGTSESFAQRVADAAASYGFRATIGTLDSVAGRFPSDGPAVVVCASFEGEPADNAGHFVQWLTSLKGRELSNLRYAVFGCGNKDWTQTYQRIPKLVDSQFEQHGGQRLLDRGEGDASSADFFESFDSWESKLWEILPEEYHTVIAKTQSPGLEVHTVNEGSTRAADLRQHDAALGVVVENRVLTAPGTQEKRHIEFQLPAGITTRAGDYLAILPSNPPRDVHRAVSRFGLLPEQEVTLTSSGPTSLPVGRPITVNSLLSGYVELSQPATTRDLRILLAAESSEETQQVLRDFQSSYAEKVQAARISVLDILEDHPDLKISFATYLSMLPFMRVRQYSISSSPLWNPEHVTLSVSVLDVAIPGRKEPFLGVASTFLANLRPGDKVQMAVRASNTAFHLPQDPKTPLVLLCAGSGLAPMRGFLQERALQKKAGREVGKAILFFGCRNPREDYLYSDSDLKEWEELGIVKLRPAFSRAPEESDGCKYVQNRLWHNRKDIEGLYEVGARYYVCGSGKIARGVKDTLIAIIKEAKGVDDAEATSIFERATVGRFAADIFE